ncbi:dynein axonemal assembly factor 4-like [Tubulanus polymorphus]|uniref:dynein axonemal assembly factor 4-like n=1 Tax=Tubulanus polymorphus TaxID=672921 RepID=UPI003DA3184B
MPLSVEDYSWEDSDTTVVITVPLKGAKTAKIDVMSSVNYVKVNNPPYIFECMLFGSIDDNQSSATIENGLVTFRLKKCVPGHWDQLHSPKSADKELMKTIREEAVRRAHERAEIQEKEKSEKKREREKLLVQQAMRIDQEERERIEKQKENEKAEAMRDLEKWKQERRLQALEAKKILLQENQKIDDTRVAGKKRKTVEAVNQEPVREIGKIGVAFTPRVFPTAARESQKDQEDEWLKKQADRRQAASKAIGDGDFTEEENDPIWLQDKGNSLFKSGNLLGAVNAYTHAIQLSPNLPSLHSNRAACHLKLGNLMKCIEDASRALELLTPAVQLNAASRLKVHVRRGTALCQLGLYVEGLMDYDAALKIDPNNQQIIKDMDNIRVVIQGSNIEAQ